MICFVTGCAGFIGSNLVDRLLERGDEVIGLDNFSSGHIEYLENALKSPNFKLIEGDALDADLLTEALQGVDLVFHFSANADIRFGLQHPHKDLEQNTQTTFNVLEAMRQNGVARIVFSSSGSVYGEPVTFPTPEDAPFPVQTSLYGASKVAGEGLISSYCTGFGFQGYIFRFVSILGERYNHGHVYDFYKRLQHNPDVIEVLGDGNQQKSYLHIEDCLDGILLALDKATGPVNIYNLGNLEYCKVNDSLDLITNYLDLQPERHYTGGERGWIGDSPFVFLSTDKIQSLGWKPKIRISDGILRTLEYLSQNQWLFDRR